MELDYRLYENAFGTMYHLLLDRAASEDGVRFVNDTDKTRYAAVNGSPIFFDWDQEFRIAIEFTIMYPKIYVKKSIPFFEGANKVIERTAIC